MNLDAAIHPQKPSARYAGRPVCPCCADRLVAPQIAAFAGEGRIWHTWLCERCDHEFVTCVDLRS